MYDSLFPCGSAVHRALDEEAHESRNCVMNPSAVRTTYMPQSPTIHAAGVFQVGPLIGIELAPPEVP